MGVVFEGGCGSFELENEKLPSVAPVRDRRFHHGKKEAREFLREERGGGKGIEWLGFAVSGGRQIRLGNF